MSFNAQDLLWLLLPLAFLSGWFAARLEARRQAGRSFDLPSAYFKGLNFLLNEQPDKAIETSRKLARASGRRLDDIIAQYYCELAEQAIAKQNGAGAREYLRQALAADANCVRANIVLGDLEAREEKYREAIHAWQQ